MIKGIDHIAIAVESIDETLATLGTVFGMIPRHREKIDTYEVEVATIQLGNTAIELVAGVTPDSPISKFIEKRGAGIHHIALEVDNIDTAMKDVSRHADMIDKKPRDGKEGSKVAFVHPRSTSKVLFELVENE